MKKPQQTLPKYNKVVSLIPGGTMQFLDLGFDITKAPRPKTQFCEFEIPIDGNEVKVALRCITQSVDGDHFIDLQTGEPLISQTSGLPDLSIQPDYSISIDKAIEPFESKWIPLPFFRTEGNIGSLELRYRYGPTDWARAIIKKLSTPDIQGNTHRLVIAFDTHIQADIDVTNARLDEGYASLAEMDMRDGAELSLVTEFKSYAWFLGLDWVRDWLKELFLETIQKKFPNRRIIDSESEYKCEYLARYITFIELLGAVNITPKIKLTDPRRHSEPIDVDLVLDIGNSRTIGMLIEKRPGESVSLDNGSILELRDLSKPTLNYRDTFSSYVCFSRAHFGDPHRYSHGSGRDRPSFSWPSVVRIGTEASRIAANSRGGQGQTSMSSPKRYLWDLKPRVQQWFYAKESNNPYSQETPVNNGDFVGFVNNEGTPIHIFQSNKIRNLDFIKDQKDYPVTEPKFSRSSMMMFLISEIVTQALVQANSPTERNKKVNPDLPRRLRNIILTTPPAMATSERRLYEQWANWAVEIVWKALGWDELPNLNQDYRAKPKVRMNLDEASATQLVFIYNEIEKRFSGDSSLYFEIFGKSRQRYNNQKTLRVASIDIGGGTTDMVITTYLSESAGATNILIPHQEFREGFNVAGDDILKGVIESHLIPELIAYLTKYNPSINQSAVMQRLGRNAVNITQHDRSLRAQFSQQILIPLTLSILTQIEKLSIEELPSFSAYEVDVRSILGSMLDESSEVIRYITDITPNHDLANLKLMDWRPNVNLASVGSTITATLAPYLQNMAEVIKLWDCDYLILSGRPSCLSPIQGILFKSPPVQPSRIIPMSDYEVEGWYPFATTQEGKIDDPKTTGVVGALLYAVSEGNLHNFHIRTTSLKPASTIKFIGPMSVDKQIKKLHLLFDGQDVSQIKDEEITCSMSFQTQTFIGFRQMGVERWKTTPFYQLAFASQRAAEQATVRGPYVVTLSYSRRFPDEEDAIQNAENEGVLKLLHIEDRDGASIPKTDLELSLRSLWEESHWLDTGEFVIN